MNYYLITIREKGTGTWAEVVAAQDDFDAALWLAEWYVTKGNLPDDGDSLRAEVEILNEAAPPVLHREWCGECLLLNVNGYGRVRKLRWRKGGC